MLYPLLLTLFALAIIAFYLYINSGVKLPTESHKIIADVVAGKAPELVTGTTGIAKSGNLDIWYEVIDPPTPAKATVLLIMGHNSTAMLWSAKFYQPLVDAGYQVIRYDNRDVGLSTWLKPGDKDFPYNLEDMARDGIAVLDAAGVNKAHAVGASMGGMIAQRMAISHNDRLLSLTSIMSSGYMMDPELPPVPKWFMQNFIKLGIRYLLFGGEAGSVKFFIGVLQTLRGDGPYELDVHGASQIMLYETRARRGFNKKAIKQQARAIAVSGSRLSEMGRIHVPTLVIHGTSDPLVIFAHAQKYAPLIPKADTLFIEGMGHDLPELYIPQMLAAMLTNFTRAILHPGSGNQASDESSTAFASRST